MKVITRQLTKEILLSTGFVLISLVAIFAFFDLIRHLDDIGPNFSLGKAFLLTGLTAPLRIYQVMPLAVLLAAIFTFSRWAQSSEFTVLRVAGMSSWQLVRVLLVPGIVLVLVTYSFGEVISPWASRYAQTISSSDAGLSLRGGVNGVWLRDVTKNTQGVLVDRYINVKSLPNSATSDTTGAWKLFEFDKVGHLLRIIRADHGVYAQKGGWNLKNVSVLTYPPLDTQSTQVTDDQVVRQNLPELFVNSTLVPSILGVMAQSTDQMSILELARYVKHLDQTNQQSEHYAISMWSKVFYPLAVLVMLAVSMPAAYMNVRSGDMAFKIFFGVLIGIAFYALNNVFSYLGILNDFPAFLVTLIPTILMLIFATVAMYLVEKR